MSTTKTIRFVYKRAPDYRLLPANGGFGGLTTSGAISIDFYVERQAMPAEEIIRVREDSAVQRDIIPDVAEKIIDREVLVGFLLTSSSAKAIGQWLIEQADKAERLQSTGLEIDEKADANED
jgi:hypothetical protein